ncbi:type IV secretory system conjugative DNA transfer family protein, partial [Pseudosulfitobacter sp. DSM 107133]
ISFVAVNAIKGAASNRDRSKDPDELWEDAKFLAALLIVTKSKTDATWEDQGRELLTLFLACVGGLALEQRSMTQVLDLMAGINLDETFEDILQEDADYPSTMRRTAKKYADIRAASEKQWAGITSAANQHLAVWEGSKVEKVTAASDWTPMDFRKSPAPTLYLQVPPNAIDTYAPLLRVIIAQHVNELMREEPNADAPPILFMLDEMPQLGMMEPIKKALTVGRSYKIQLWMFAQNLGQLQEVYGKETAATMVESCGVEMYMNPRQETADRLSKALGTREDVLSGKTVPVVTPQALTGPEWKDDILVFATGEKPLRLKKAFFHEMQSE